MSHHASGPNFGFPRGDSRLDMTDLYAFTKPGDPKVAGDKVGPHGDPLDEFPYLGPPHKVWSAL